LARRGLGVSAGTLAAVLTETTMAKATPPAPLLESTIRLSAHFAVGTARQVLSAPLAALVEGVLQSMFLNKVKVAAIILLTLGLLGSGTGFVAHRIKAGQPAPKPAPSPAGPVAVADKAKDKTAEPKPKPKPDEAFAVARPDAASRLKEWHERLTQPMRSELFEDPKTTVTEMLEHLQKRYGVTFEINDKAFRVENEKNPLDEGFDVGRFEIVGYKPIPPMPNGSLATLLRIILARIPSPSGAVYVLRPDSVEITTTAALRTELGIPENRPVLPLVWDVFDETPIRNAFSRVIETTVFNVIVDPRVADKLQGKVTVQFNNVPVDTAVRLLANMAGLSVVRLDNVFYVTTAENAKRMREEQKQIDTQRDEKPAAAK
jgi:hypothetical protein